MKKTSLPSAPVCQPVTESVSAVGLAARVPVGEGRDGEDEAGDPREPLAPVAGNDGPRAGRRSGRVRRGACGGIGSGVCTVRSMGKSRSGVSEEAPRTQGSRVPRSSMAGRAAGYVEFRERRRGSAGRVPVLRVRLRRRRPTGAAAVPDVRAAPRGERSREAASAPDSARAAGGARARTGAGSRASCRRRRRRRWRRGRACTM